MRDSGDVHEILVVEKLVLFRRHEVPVKTEELSERRGIVHLYRLIGGLEALVFAQ